jgi:hypothetical protein
MNKLLHSLDKIAKANNSVRLLSDSEVINRSLCRAQKRIYIGQIILGGSWVQCSKKHRPGKLTCYWHRNLEE